MELIELIQEFGPFVGLAIAGALIVWSNSRSNEQNAKNMGGVIELSGKLVSNSDRVTAAIERFSDDNKDHLDALRDQIGKAADSAGIHRTANTKHLDEQFAQVIGQLEAIQQAVNGGVTLADFRALSDDLRTIITEVKSSLIEIKTAVIPLPAPSD